VHGERELEDMSEGQSQLQAIIADSDARMRQVIKNIYVEAIHFIAARVPDFHIHQPGILAIDSQPANAPANRWSYATGWPNTLTPRCNVNDYRFLPNLATYKGTLVDIYIDSSVIYLKFPTVVLKGYKIHSYTSRNWKRAAAAIPGERYYTNYYDNTDIDEAAAFAKGVLLTKEAFLAKHRWVNVCTKNELNRFQLSINLNEDLNEQIVVAHNKYLSTVKRNATNQLTSEDVVYKNYVKYRGKVLLERYQAANPPKIVDISATRKAFDVGM
jgi:hypothetical protein